MWIFQTLQSTRKLGHMRRKDNYKHWTGNMNAFDWRRTEYGGAKLVTMNTFLWEYSGGQGYHKRCKKNKPYSYIALDKMNRTFLLRWATLDLHQKKKHRMRKHWNYWKQIFPSSKRHIWKTLVPTSKTGGVRHSRSVCDQTIPACWELRHPQIEEHDLCRKLNHTSEGRSEILFGSWNVPKVAGAVN